MRRVGAGVGAAVVADAEEVALDTFGPYRLMYGSDWPVCTLAGSYSQVYDARSPALGELAEEARAGILGVNAKGFYSLPDS